MEPEHVRGVVLSNLGELMREKKDYTAAIEFYDQAIEALRAVYGPSHMTIATALNNKGLAFQFSGDAETAEALYRESLAMRQELLPASHPDIAQSMNNLAQFLRNAGKCAEAEPLYREALDLARQSLPPGHYMLAMMRKNLGTCLMLLERFEEAETEIQACYEHLIQTPDAPPQYVTITIEALVALYDKWAAADPQSGAAEKAAEWREKLAARKPN
jgi:tetratricopeptide (TPR) repeat protein